MAGPSEADALSSPIGVARSAGASAKFAGSGGAICGVYHGEAQYEQLSAALSAIRCTVLKPQIFLAGI